MLQAELGNGLASLLLVARVDGDGGALGDHGITTLLALGLVAGLILLNLDVLLLRLIGELFNAGVGHFCGVVRSSKLASVVVIVRLSGLSVRRKFPTSA